jgi:hypothetical protein
MQLSDQFLAQLFMLLLQGLKVTPFFGIKEIHEVKELPNIVVQRCL